jgi:hypothetical protein
VKAKFPAAPTVAGFVAWARANVRGYDPEHSPVTRGHAAAASTVAAAADARGGNADFESHRARASLSSAPWNKAGSPVPAPPLPGYVRLAVESTDLSRLADGMKTHLAIQGILNREAGGPAENREGYLI